MAINNFEERLDLNLENQLYNFNSDLRKLRYGGNQDTLPAGQPFIQKDIPEPDESVGGNFGPDVILRGGALQPVRSATDAVRLSKLLFNFRSPEGLLFTANQNLLSKSNVKTQGSDRFLGLNQGAYLPTSTILQAAVGGINGVHLNKQGLNPFRLTDESGANLFGITGAVGDFLNRLPGELPVYLHADIKGGERGDTNRLVQLTRAKIGEVLTENVEEPLRVGPLAEINPFNNPNSISILDGQLISYSGGPGSVAGFGQTVINRVSNTINHEERPTVPTAFQSFQSLFEVTVDEEPLREYSTPSEEVVNRERSTIDTPSTDFREDSNAPDYENRRIQERVNLGNPGGGTLEDRADYQTGRVGAQDKITMSEIYSSGTGPDHTRAVNETNDLVKFRIAAVDSESPSNSRYMHFRAFIESFQDSFSAEWQSQKFMGRAENFYRYQGFDRQINLSFKAAAQSKQELMPMYHKLNYLVSNTTPDYVSDNRYMAGPLVRMTVGGYLYEQYGFISSVTLDIPNESPWEIAIPSGNNTSGVNSTIKFSDDLVKELPHYIDVNMAFTPIHDFVPRKTTGGRTGRQKYLALTNGFVDGYTTY